MDVQRSFPPDESGRAAGKLYLVATPIGNLEDMTFRAVRILREASIIAAEDTRQTRKLLTHYEISGRLVSYHEHNKRQSGPELIRLMLEGQSVALVSDAGMPAVSDPGADLVVLAVEQGVPVIPIPGANAALSALVVSGLPTDRFTFAGFLPRERKRLEEALDGLSARREPVVLYESPHRVVKTLTAVMESWGNCRVALARELTKRYEEIARGTVEEALAWLQEAPPQGEYCLVLYRDDDTAALAGTEPSAWWEGLTLEQHVARYEEQGDSRKEAIKRTAADRRLPKREVYNELHR